MSRFFTKVLGVVLIATLSACSYSYSGQEDFSFRNVFAFGIPDNDMAMVQGLILPHHNFVGDYIDETYESLVSDGFAADYDRVILLCTNHNDLGRSYILTDPDLDMENDLASDLVVELREEMVLGVEPGVMANEHGIKVHIDRIEKFLPEVQVLPVIIKWKTPEEALDSFVASVLATGDMDRTLVIASIDFSHFVKEDTAVLNDERIEVWLENLVSLDGTFNLEDVLALEESVFMDTDTSTAMDSPETLYIFSKLMRDSLGEDMYLDILRRTSSLSLSGKFNGDPLQNTSHLFVRVGKKEL